MGAHPYWYFEPYKQNINEALQELRQREFNAGRYNPVIAFPKFPPGPRSHALGAQHATIDEAREDAAEDGTRSILDLDHISEQTELCAVTALDREALLDLYDTDHPTRKMVEENMEFLDGIERGQGVYFIIYKNDIPTEILFGGYSFD